MPSADREPKATTWTIVVETPAGGVTPEHVGPFLRALVSNAAALAPAASFDAETQTLAAQFQVSADTRDHAALRGSLAYWGAIAAAGLTPAAESTVEVAPIDDAADARRFTAHADVRRAWS